jgi:hypothetical protein
MVTSPLQKTFLHRTISDPQISLQKAADAKITKSRALCEGKGLAFFPLVVSTFGAWQQDAATNIKELAKLQSENNGRPIND